jgi:hypothetical protein
MKKKPTSVKKVVKNIIEMLTIQRKNEIKNCEDEDLFNYHRNLGMLIRNEFNLWKGNDQLLRDCLRIQRTRYIDDYRLCKEYYKKNNVPIKIIHPDDASMIILRELKRRLAK